MATLYLEYAEEDLIMMPSEAFVQEEDDEEDEFGEYIPPFETDPDEPTREQYVAFIPHAAYRNPIQGCKEIEVDFDTTNLDKIHLVVVRYSETDANTEYSGKWYIEAVCASRREAKEYEKKLHESDDEHVDKPWAQNDCEIEEIEIASVPLED